MIRRLRPILLAAALAIAAPAFAQTIPSQPVRLIVPVAAGGGIDTAFRAIAPAWGDLLGQPVVVENKPGGGQILGSDLVAKAKPDGYTLLAAGVPIAFNTALGRKLPYDAVRDFTPISHVVSQPLLVVVHPSVPAKTFGELVAYAKAHPGEVNYGSAGPGSIFHLAGEMLEQQAGVKMTHVPYKGAAPALTDLMGGQVQVMFTTIPTALQHIRAGKLRPIAVTGAKRSALFPDLPTAREAGMPGMVVDSWFALFAPRGLAPEVQSRLVAAAREVLTDPATVRKLEEQGALAQPSTPAELAKVLTADLASWKTVIATAKVTLD